MWICSHPDCTYIAEAETRPADHCPGYRMLSPQELATQSGPEPS